MDGLILLRPLWLLALLPLAGLVLLRVARSPDAGGWERVMGHDMLRAMQVLGALGGRQPLWMRLLAPLALAALILGLAGPALPRTDAPVLAQADAVVLAMDLSPSVAQGPGLDQAKLADVLSQGLDAFRAEHGAWVQRRDIEVGEGHHFHGAVDLFVFHGVISL